MLCLQRYIKLLWESRNTATTTEVYIKGIFTCFKPTSGGVADDLLKDFLEVILPGVEELEPGDSGALADALADLNEFINVE